MRGKRAKDLRRLSGFNINQWRGMANEEKYRIQKHEKTIWYRTIGDDGKPVSVPKQDYRFTLLCRSHRAAYKHLKAAFSHKR